MKTPTPTKKRSTRGSATSATTSKSTTTQLELFSPSATPWHPPAYQKKAVKFLLQHAAAALLLDPGLGKTAIVLAALKLLLKERGGARKILVVAPMRVCHSVWPVEAQKWLDFNHLKVVVLHGPDKEPLLNQPADVYVVNPEGLAWLLGAIKVKSANGKFRVVIDHKRWRSLGFDTLVIDELSKFKHPKSARFKALKEVLHTFRRRWGLTGSPAANRLMDLFGECYMLDQGRSLGQFITHYRSRYFLPVTSPARLGLEAKERGFNVWRLREGADEEIYARLRPLALRMAAEDYLDMPKLIHNIIPVELPEAAREVYDALHDDLVAKIGDRTVTAANRGVALGKCWQVCNGGLYLDDEVRALIKLPKGTRDVVELHEAKLDALEDLIDELQGSPLLVAYQFQHELARLQKRLGKDIPYLGGGVSPKRSAELQHLWNRGDLPVLLGHPQAMGHGLNLQGAGNHVCWHTLLHDYELYDQLIRRVYRQGQSAARVFVHHLVARRTVDEAMLGVLRSKQRGQEALFEALAPKRKHKK